MKVGWQIKNLGDVCNIIGGGTPSKENSEFYKGEIPWATVRDMRNDLLFETEYKINELAVVNSSTNIIPSGNVVIATRVGLGKVCIIGQDTAINQDLRGIIPINTKILIVRYLYWWLKSIADIVVSQGTGATVQGVKLPFVKSLKIPLPPIKEQQRIVAILDKAFDGVATAKANAEKNLKNVHALFDSHLELVFSQTDWKLMRLAEVSKDFGRGKSKHRPRNDPKLYDGKYPFIQTGEIRNSNHVITKYTQTYNDIGLAQSKLWPKGTLCITIAANIAETGILDFDACFPDSVIGVVVNQEITSQKFLEYLLRSFKTILQSQGKGSAQDNINLGTFENLLFPFPSIKEQQEIVSTLDELREQIKNLESIYQQKLTALEELKKSLLHQAFTGQL